MVGLKKIKISTLVGVLVFGILAGTVHAQAQNNQAGFSLRVTPSPLVATVAPGQTKELELKIQNTGTSAEELKIDPRKFSVGSDSGKVTLDDTENSEIASWIQFSSSTFTIQPGEWYTEKIRITVPQKSGYSYSTALVISRLKDKQVTVSERLINGAVAVFTLINVDRPGAVRKLEVNDFSSLQGVYEFLPATFTTMFKNRGNTIVQPSGNIFIQRSESDTEAISTIPLNDTGGYILPDTTRSISSQWLTGFPFVKASTNSNGATQQVLEWDWSKLTDFRIGPYTAKLVAIYNDGANDIPIIRTVSFWVFPWKTLLLVLFIVGGLLYLRHIQIKRKTQKAVKRALEQQKKEQGSTNASK